MELAMENGFGTVGFTELNEQEMMMVDGGGVLLPSLIGAAICAVGTVALVASCGTLAPVVVMGVAIPAKVVGGVVGAAGGAIGGAIKGALN